MSHKIEKWQHSVPAEGSAEPSSSETDGLASRLSRTATELFSLALQHAQRQTSKPVFRTLEREYGFFLLWCNGYGAVNGDLDDVLAESRGLRNSTHRLLVSICQTLTDKLVGVLLPGLDDTSQRRLIEKRAEVRVVVDAMSFAIPDAGSSDSDTDSESDCSLLTGDASVEELLEDIKTDIQCLVDLGPLYKEPIRDRAVAEEVALPRPVTTWDPAEYWTSRIRHRYPNADTGLAHALGKANWDRAQRLYAEKEKNIREAQRPETKPESMSIPSGTVVASDFHDSGLGTSMTTPSSYAETVLSYHGTKGGSIKIPPVPPEAVQGVPFACDICGRRCKLPDTNWKSFWKKHVLSDLQPYICVVTSCLYNTVAFPSRASWIHHLDLEHGFANLSESFTCPLCEEELISGEKAHMARHLEEVSLTIVPANAESNEDSDGNTGDESDTEIGVSNSFLPKPDTISEPKAGDHHDKHFSDAMPILMDPQPKGEKDTVDKDPERIYTPQQASSYWSVSEAANFPGLLRTFGTDWVEIANYMQTKTAKMVKNYYVRQAREGGKQEWEQIAMEADTRAQRGNKQPAPPTLTQRLRKRYDTTSPEDPQRPATPDLGTWGSPKIIALPEINASNESSGNPKRDLNKAVPEVANQPPGSASVDGGESPGSDMYSADFMQRLDEEQATHMGFPKLDDQGKR